MMMVMMMMLSLFSHCSWFYLRLLLWVGFFVCLFVCFISFCIKNRFEDLLQFSHRKRNLNI